MHIRKRSFVFAGLFFFIAAGVCLARTSRLMDVHGQSIASGSGTLEFRVKLLKDIASDPHDHVLLLGVSSDRRESFKIQIIQDQLIAQRRFGRCVLAAFGHPYRFNVGEWHSLKLAWNNASTKFFVDDQEIRPLGLFSSGDLPKMLPGIRLGVENNFMIETFRTTGGSDIREEQADQDFVQTVVCTDLAQILTENPQEKYRGIALLHFPDRASRDKIKTYIDLLPDGFAGSIKHIVFVEDARFLKGGAGGYTDSASGSVVLKGSFYDTPTVFFHEAAHLYDYRLRINFGVPDQKSEWAAISGASCYFKGAKMDEFYDEFMKTSVQNGILGAQGGQCAFEDLAIWVGTVYDLYLKNKTLADRLDPSSPTYSKKNIQKLNFLLKKGFISREIYDKITR